MTRDQLIQAMSLMTFTLDVDYTMSHDYFSIRVNPGLDKPLEQDLQVLYDAWEYKDLFPARVEALGDIPLLVGVYIQANISSVSQGDSWNPAGFDSDKFESNWGWLFQNLAKPTILQLEAIKAQLNE